jgi:hypothetical protein
LLESFLWGVYLGGGFALVYNALYRRMAVKVAGRTNGRPAVARLGRLDWRRFQDGESMVVINDALEGADVAILARLADASAKLIGCPSDRTNPPALP